MDRLEEITSVLPERLKLAVVNRLESKRSGSNIVVNGTDIRSSIIYKKLQEIRLRVNAPFAVMYDNNELLFADIIVTIDEVRQCLQYISSYSVYAHHEDIKRGFITLKGGHRAGLAGQAISDNGKITAQKNISFINIRVAHELPGCSDKIMDFIWKGNVLKHMLIISPPACGKTTLLRDTIRQLSYGTSQNGILHKGLRVGVIDERSEIAACYEGIPQNDIGPRTDVLDQACKSDGMMLMLRSMSPQVIAVDELGGTEDINAVRYLMHCGCIVLATVHGYDFEEILGREEFRSIIGEHGFSRIIVLSNINGIGTVKEMIEL